MQMIYRGPSISYIFSKLSISDPPSPPLLSGSSHIGSVLIGVDYRNSHQTLDVYLHFAILLGQIE